MSFSNGKPENEMHHQAEESRNEKPDMWKKEIYTATGRTRNAQAIESRGEEKMTTETQGKTEKDNINQDKQQTQPKELVSPKAGTATSSPKELHVPQLFNILYDNP